MSNFNKSPFRSAMRGYLRSIVVVLALCELLAIIARSRASGILYRVEPPVYDGSVNVTRPAILNVCTGDGKCRAVCADEVWGNRMAQAICEHWMEYHRVMALNHTLPEKLSHRVGRVKLSCVTGSADSCTITELLGSCATGVAALDCKVLGELVPSPQWQVNDSEIETLKLLRLSEMKVNLDNVEEITTEALALVDTKRNLSVDDVHYSVVIYDKVQQSGISNNSKVHMTLMNMTGIILSNDPKTLYEGELRTNSSTRAVENLEWTAGHYVIPSNQSVDVPLIQVQNIVMDAVVVSAHAFKGTTFSESRDSHHHRRTNMKQFPISSSSTRLGISVPETLLDRSPVNSSNVRIQFIAYKTNSFFQGSNDEEDVIPSSDVLSCRVGSQDNTQLKDPVEIRFSQFLWDGSFFPRCVYWNITLNSGHGGWSDRGCQLIETTDEFITCSCNHLTSFSALMALCSSENENSTGCPCKAQDEAALSYISLVGCVISAFALLLTSLVLLVNMCQKKRGARYSPVVLQLCLCLALLLGLVFFILATQSAGKHDGWCVVSAALLQYFVCSAVLLMLVEGISMYRDIVLVLASLASSKFTKIALTVAWGVPAVVVLILIVVHNTSGTKIYDLIMIYRNDTSPGIADGMYCWLQSTPIILATFAGPVILIEIFNIFVAIRIYIALKSRVRTATEKSMDFKRRLRAMIVVTSLFGVTLVFGAVTLIDIDSWFSSSNNLCILPRVFHYLFAIVNSLQGLAIFVFTVLLSPDRRKLITSLCKGKRPPKERVTVTTEMATLSARTRARSPSDSFSDGAAQTAREAETASL